MYTCERCFPLMGRFLSTFRVDIDVKKFFKEIKILNGQGQILGSFRQSFMYACQRWLAVYQINRQISFVHTVHAYSVQYCNPARCTASPIHQEYLVVIMHSARGGPGPRQGSILWPILNLHYPARTAGCLRAGRERSPAPLCLRNGARAGD